MLELTKSYRVCLASQIMIPEEKINRMTRVLQMADEDAEALVIDNGSGSIKAGIAGEDAPKVRRTQMANPGVGLASLSLAATGRR